MHAVLELNHQYFSFESTQMDREEEKEKESCDKSLSAESKDRTKNPWKAYPQDSQPKFIAGRTPAISSMFSY